MQNPYNKVHKVCEWVGSASGPDKKTQKEYKYRVKNSLKITFCPWI